MFVDKYIEYTTSFKDKYQAGKIKDIKNLSPSKVAIETVFEQLYWIINNSSVNKQ